MAKKNHNRQAAWIGRGWGTQSTSTDPAAWTVSLFDLGRLFRRCHGRGETTWPSIESLLASNIFRNPMQAHNAGIDFENPNEADELFATLAESTPGRVLDIVTKFARGAGTTADLTNSELSQVENFASLHMTRQAANIISIQNKLDATLSSGAPISIFGCEDDARKFLKLVDDYRSHQQDMTITSSAKQQLLDQLFPNLLAHKMHSDFSETKSVLAKFGHTTVFVAGEGVFLSSPQAFITEKDFLCMTSSDAELLFDFYEQQFNKTINQETRDRIRTGKFVFGALSKNLAICFFDESLRDISNELAEFLAKATHHFFSVHHPSGRIVAANQKKLEESYKLWTKAFDFKSACKAFLDIPEPKIKYKNSRKT